MLILSMIIISMIIVVINRPLVKVMIVKNISSRLTFL